MGLGTAIGSRLILRANFLGTANQTALLNALLSVVNMVTYQFATPNPLLLSYGAPVQVRLSFFQISSSEVEFKVDQYCLLVLPLLVTTPANYPGDGTSSVTPAWRNSLWHVFIVSTKHPSPYPSACINSLILLFAGVALEFSICE